MVKRDFEWLRHVRRSVAVQCSIRQISSSFCGLVIYTSTLIYFFITILFSLLYTGLYQYIKWLAWDHNDLRKATSFQGACYMFHRAQPQSDVCSGLPKIRAIWWPYGVAYATGLPRALGWQGKLVKLGARPDHLRYMHCFVQCWWPSPNCQTPGIYAAQPLWLWVRWEPAVRASLRRRLPYCLCSFMMGPCFQQRCGCPFYPF